MWPRFRPLSPDSPQPVVSETQTKEPTHLLGSDDLILGHMQRPTTDPAIEPGGVDRRQTNWGPLRVAVDIWCASYGRRLGSA
jgi:hypothetical protein